MCDCGDSQCPSCGLMQGTLEPKQCKAYVGKHMANRRVWLWRRQCKRMTKDPSGRCPTHRVR